MNLYLVRHGQSTWNVQGRVQGQTMHPPLTELGRAQAERAACALRDAGIVRMLASDQVRALQTAQIIGARIGVPPLPSSLLREQDLGSWQGLTTEQALAAWRDRFGDDGWTDPGREAQLRAPGGESLADVGARVAALLASPLVTEAPGAVALVSHGDTIRIAIGHLLGESPADMPWREIGNGQVCRVGPDRTVVTVPAGPDIDFSDMPVAARGGAR